MSSSLQEETSDLGYCKGNRAEKAAMVQSKLKPKPALKNSLDSPGPGKRMTHSNDIKERMRLLEDSMARHNYTRDVGKPIDKNDPEYGKPQQGTWTALRGEKAHSHIHKEILELCEVIYTNGYSLDESEIDEDTAAFAVIKFGHLFKMYTRISDKVVGLLLRAKKYRLVFFEPEMLFQGQDEETLIYLLKPMKEIYRCYNKDKKSFTLPN